MDISRAASVALLTRTLELVRADNNRLRRVIDEVPALLEELARCEQPAVKRWVWDALTTEAETLLDDLEEGRMGRPPEVLRLFVLTVDERLTVLAAFSEHATLAARALTQFRDLLLTNPGLCTRDGLGLLGRLLNTERQPSSGSATD